MSYVIACGDEGVQVNEGTRLGFVGAGFRLDGFSDVVPVLKKLFGKDLRIAASEECDWMRKKLSLDTWEQVTASSQQHIEAIADREKLLYAGFIPFADPKKLEHDIKAHMVRPREVHIANKLCFTLGGGEQTYNLGCYLISADWVHAVDQSVAEKVITQQVEFYKQLAKRDDFQILFEYEGELGEEIAYKNAAILNKLGFEATE